MICTCVWLYVCVRARREQFVLVFSLYKYVKRPTKKKKERDDCFVSERWWFVEKEKEEKGEMTARAPERSVSHDFCTLLRSILRPRANDMVGH